MKALAIMGSPRSQMNTDILLNKVIEGMQVVHGVSVEKIELKNKKIKPCIACGYCGKTGVCFILDDMNALYKKFDTADIIIVGSPLYFNSVTSIVKTMVDRCQAFWSSKYILNRSTIDRSKKRKGMFIGVAGGPQKENGFIGATVVMDLFFKCVNTEYSYNLLVDNTDQSFVGNQVELLDQAFKIGQKMVRI